MPLGSLEDHLHDLPPDKEPLDWNTRMKIAAGAAKGLEYLHDQANPPVIYRDLKSSNILLGEGYHPKLSDFGLAKLGPVGDKTHVSTRVMGTYGRKAIDNTRSHGEHNLVAWARPLFKDRRKFPKMADPLLQGRYPMRGLYQALAVAAMCLQEQAATRPLIDGLDSSDGSPSTHRNSPDYQTRNHPGKLKMEAELGRNETGGGSGREWGFERHRGSPLNTIRTRESPRNVDLHRERAVAEAKVWGENLREKKRVNAIGSFDGTND
ncbi:hypothetical protein V6N13_116088 [Hibiscus sabdariffa]